MLKRLDFVTGVDKEKCKGMTDGEMKSQCCPSQCSEHPLWLLLNISKCRIHLTHLVTFHPLLLFLKFLLNQSQQLGCYITKYYVLLVFKYIPFRPKPFQLQLKWKEHWIRGQKTKVLIPILLLYCCSPFWAMACFFFLFQIEDNICHVHD